MSAQIAEVALAMRSNEAPLVVDVDGALVVTDLLHEAALQFVARHPLQACRMLGWLAVEKSNFKSCLADRINPGIQTVPLRHEVLALIRSAQTAGRPVYLSSASDSRYVAELAQRIGGIAGIFGNLSGDTKAERLIAAFGAREYDYVGDKTIDFAVWRSARRPLIVAHSASFAKRVLSAFPRAEIVSEPRPALSSYIEALRMPQWAKNVLIFLPMIAGHRFDLKTIYATIVAFLCFCFAASSAYVINDLLDLPGDRDHPLKKRRPFAAGKLPIKHGLVLAALLMAAAFGLSLLLPVRFTGILSIYIACTLSYSLLLKRKVLIDVIMLAGFYTLRVFGGLAAINTHQTQWLLMFCLFLFLSLAIVKRCSELVANRVAGKAGTLGRDYRVDDLSVLLPLAAAAGYGAVFVVALYLSSPEMAALYTHPNRLWLACPLLMYWISRVLIYANRGDLNDDPVTFALTDRTSWITAACMACVIAVSI